MTRSQLGEALAVCGETTESILRTLDRLTALDQVHRGAQSTRAASNPATRRADAEGEVARAQTDLDLVKLQFLPGPAADRRLIKTPLSQAMFRVIVARRYLAGLPI
jgi:hypothetical protein